MAGNSSQKWYNLLPTTVLDRLVKDWLLEDAPSFDWSAYVLTSINTQANNKCSAMLWLKQWPCLLAGRPFVDAVMRACDCTVTWFYDDGILIAKNGSSKETKQLIAKIEGSVEKLLQGERLALNILSRCCGIATQVYQLCSELKEAGWTGRLACTRKTTPGFRLVEKYGVMVGGGEPHRVDLSSSIVMLKDNHVTALAKDNNSSVEQAVKSLKQLTLIGPRVEVEVANEEQALVALSAGADIIMLDNFNAEEVNKVATTLKARCASILVEVSGGINKENMLRFCSPNVDVISMGCLTQGYPVVDFSMKLESD